MEHNFIGRTSAACCYCCRQSIPIPMRCGFSLSSVSFVRIPFQTIEFPRLMLFIWGVLSSFIGVVTPLAHQFERLTYGADGLTQSFLAQTFGARLATAPIRCDRLFSTPQKTVSKHFPVFRLTYSVNVKTSLMFFQQQRGTHLALVPRRQMVTSSDLTYEKQSCGLAGKINIFSGKFNSTVWWKWSGPGIIWLNHVYFGRIFTISSTISNCRLDARAFAIYCRRCAPRMCMWARDSFL